MTFEGTLRDQKLEEGGRSGRPVLSWLAIYFTLQIIARCFVSGNLQLDEAEQLILTQDWQLGYGSQPPLYTWLQKLVFTIFGTNVFSLTVLKNVCLYGGYLLIFFGAREILEDENLAGLASASLLFSPHVAWESQRDQTHLILATTLAAATMFTWLKVSKTRKMRWYILFGVVSGLGLLSKYNFAIVLAALIGAAVIQSSTRSAVLSPRFFVALTIISVLVAPHMLWALKNPALVSSQSYKFQINPDPAFLIYFRIIIRFFKATGAFVAVPLLIFSPLLIRLRTHWRNPSPPGRFLFLLILCGLILALFLAVTFRTTYLRDRWFQPLLVFTPVLLIAISRNEIDARSRKRLLQVSITVSLIVLISVSGTVVFANLIGRAHNLNFPHSEFASELRKAPFANGTIIAEGFFLGGNLKKQFPNSRVVVPEYQLSIEPKYPIAIVWRSADKTGPPESIQACAKNLGIDVTNKTPQYIEIQRTNGSRHLERLGFILLTKNATGSP